MGEGGYVYSRFNVKKQVRKLKKVRKGLGKILSGGMRAALGKTLKQQREGPQHYREGGS